MASIVTDEGRNWYRDKFFNNQSDEKPYKVAVGTGTSSPSPSDTSLDTHEHTSNDGNSNCTVAPTSSTGEYEFKITVSGGAEVTAGATITEIGVFTDGTEELLYRETRSGVTLNAGDRKTFQGFMQVVNT